MRTLLILIIIVAVVLLFRLTFTKLPDDAAQEEVQVPREPEHPRPAHRRRRRSKKRHPRPAPPAESPSTARETEAKEAEYHRPKDAEYVPGQPVDGCPNTSNPHHHCTPYCFQRWAQRPPAFAQHDRLDNFELANKTSGMVY